MIFGRVLFIVLDLTPIIEAKRIDNLSYSNYLKDTLSFLENTLKEFSPICTLKVVFTHYPFFPFGPHWIDWYKNSKSLCLVRKDFLSILGKYKVDIVFNGHEHLYQRILYRHRNGSILMITTGGGGAPLERQRQSNAVKVILDRYTQEGYSIEDIRFVYKFNFVEVKVEKDKSGRDNFHLDVKILKDKDVLLLETIKGCSLKGWKINEKGF